MTLAAAFAQYVTGQLKLDAGRLLRDAFDQPANGSAPMPARDRVPATRIEAPVFVDVVTRTFFERVEPRLQGGQLTIVVDGQRGPGGRRDEALESERARFIALAQARGVRVVDAEVLYASHFAVSSLSLDVGPYDSHLNALGIQLLMSAAAEVAR